MSTDPLVSMRHVRAMRWCSSGARAWCARYGVEWSTFLRPGVPASVMEATGDGLGIRLAKFAREEAASGQQ